MEKPKLSNSVALDILRDLVSIPSINPQGISDSNVGNSSLIGEKRMGEYLLRFLKKMSYSFESQEVTPGRNNIITKIEGNDTTKSVLFSGHMDTVPVENMTIEPFAAIQKEGKLYGRGACDAKGTIAAFLGALHTMSAKGEKPFCNIIFLGSIDEEYLNLGVKKFVEKSSLEKICFAIVAEPTNLDIIFAHKGLLQWKIRSKGLACHSSMPENGINAIYRMAKTVSALESYAQSLTKRGSQDSLLGSPTFNVSLIQGGSSNNTVPANCSIDVEYRLIPGEDPKTVFEEIRSYLDQKLGSDFFEFDHPYFVDPPMRTDPENLMVQNFEQVAIKCTSGVRKTTVPFGTDGSHFTRVNIPTIVFGPGNMEQAHSKDEWIEIDQLYLAEKIFYNFLTNPNPFP